MQLVRLIAVVLASLLAGAGYFQERRRLETVRRLPAREALAYYEAARRSGDRVTMLVACVCGILGLLALANLLGVWR